MIFANRVMFFSGLKKKRFVSLQVLKCFVFRARLFGMVWYGIYFKVANVGSGCPISRARGSCYKRATI